MRDTWETSTLGNLVQLQRGHDLPASDRSDGNIPVMGSAGLTGWHDKPKVNGPGLVVGRSGASFGKVNFCKQDFWPLNTSLYAVDFNGNDRRFVYYMLKSIDFDRFNTGSAQPSLNRNVIHPLPVSIPPLPIQHRIADILGAYDDLIEVNRRRIEILEDMASALFREWFVEYRYPGHTEDAMQETEIGAVPEGWQVGKLKEVATVNRANIRDNNAPEEINYLTISKVNEGSIDEPEHMTWKDSPSRAKRVVQHGDILWSSVRPNLKGYGLVLNPKPNTIASTGFAVLTPDEVPYTYLYQFVTTKNFVSYLVNVATGAAYPSANVSDFKKAKVLLPTPNLLRRYHSFVEPMYEQINSLRKRNSVLREARDLLLPLLVSGEIEVETGQRISVKG